MVATGSARIGAAAFQAVKRRVLVALPALVAQAIANAHNVFQASLVRGELFKELADGEFAWHAILVPRGYTCVKGIITFYYRFYVIADGGMRANCNLIRLRDFAARVIADGGMRANCNDKIRLMTLRIVIADGGMRANCNSRPAGARPAPVIADGGMRANCNS